MTQQIHYDQTANADLKRTGMGAMALANTLQNMEYPGERLAALVYLFKCVVDTHKMNVSDILTITDKYEQEARLTYCAEFSGARMYVENELVL